jgi:hypothetical protein
MVGYPGIGKMQPSQASLARLERVG